MEGYGVAHQKNRLQNKSLKKILCIARKKNYVVLQPIFIVPCVKREKEVLYLRF